MRTITHPIWALAPLALMALGGCDAAKEGDGEGAEAPAAKGSDSSTGESASSSNVPMAETGWLTVSEDGAVFTTFLDAGGTYRDFRNGTPMQSGTWQRREDGRLCFVPEATDRVGGCWSTGELENDGTMRATDSEGRAIKLKRVTYLAPQATDADAEQSAQAAEES